MVLLELDILKAMGVCASDEEKAREQADKVDIHNAAKKGKADDVQLVLAVYPDRVNAKDRVIVPDAPLAAM